MSSLPMRGLSEGASKSQTPGRPQLDKCPDLLCRVRYSNTLPDVPFDGKFLPCPFVALDRFVEYKPSTLEKEHKFEVLCEADLGVEIDLINPATYTISSDRPKLHEVDAMLLEDDAGSRKGINLKRSAQHSKIVPWMRKTEYISHEFNRFGVSADRQETKVGYSIKTDNADIYRDRASQINAIERTFEEVKKPVHEHYSKKGVVAVSEMPILPDFEWWRFAFAQVIFDADPSLGGIPEADKQAFLEQGQIRGMQDEEGQQFVAYFTPTPETMEKRRNERVDGTHDPDYVYEHVINREYNWDVKNKASKGFDVENYFFTIREGCVFYNELETRVKLIRRKYFANKNARLQLRLTEPSETDLGAMEKRVQNLLQPTREEDEDEEEEDEEAAEDAGEEAKEAGSDGSDSEGEKREGGTPVEDKSSDEQSDQDNKPVQRKSPTTSDSDSD